MRLYIQRISQCLSLPPGDMEPITRRVLHNVDAIHAIMDVAAIQMIYTEDIDRFGAYVPKQDSLMRHFELSRYGPYPELTLTHEIGHFLDHALGSFDVYVSSEPASVLSKVMRRLESSQAVVNMRQALASSPGLLQTQRFQLLYWLNPQEQWARAYAQFIAVRSGNASLAASIEQARAARGPGVFRNVHWDYDDFTAIEAESGATFVKLGWMT